MNVNTLITDQTFIHPLPINLFFVACESTCKFSRSLTSIVSFESMISEDFTDNINPNETNEDEISSFKPSSLMKSEDSQNLFFNSLPAYEIYLYNNLTCDSSFNLL